MTDDKQNKQHDPVDEAAVDAYLRGESAVSAAYSKLDAPEPPAALDRAILEEARKAAKVGGIRGRLVEWMHWIKPLSAVAVGLLCVSVVLQVLYPSAMSLRSGDPDLASAARSVVQRPAAKSPAAELPEELKRPGASKDVLVGDVARAEQLDVPEQELVVTARKRAGAAPPAVALDAESDSARNTEFQAELSPRANAETDKVEYDMIEHDMIEQEMIEPGKAEYETAEDAAETAPRRKEDRSLLPAHDTWVAGIRYLQAGGELQRVALETRKLQLVYPELANEPAAAMVETAAGDIDELDQTVATTGKMSADAEVAASDELDATVDGVYPAPDVWLAGIEYLRAQGEVERVNLELQSFHQVYPDHPEQPLP